MPNHAYNMSVCKWFKSLLCTLVTQLNNVDVTQYPPSLTHTHTYTHRQGTAAQIRSQVSAVFSNTYTDGPVSLANMASPVASLVSSLHTSYSSSVVSRESASFYTYTLT